MIQAKSPTVTVEVHNHDAMETAFETGFQWKELKTVKETLT